MSRSTGTPPSFFDSYFGLLSTPQETIEDLLDQPKPPFVKALFLALVAVLFGPILLQLWRWDFLQTRSEALWCLAIIFLLTSAIFIPFEYLFLRIWKLPIRFSHLSALYVYCCTPLGVMALCYYAFNLLVAQGRLTITTYLITGVVDADDWLIRYFPYLQILAKLWFIYLFYCGLKRSCKMSEGATLMIAAFSAIPFHLSALLAIYLANLIWPSSVLGVVNLLLSFREIY